MRFLVALALLSLASARPGEDYYNERYDSFNIDEVLDNERLLKSYALCFLGEGKCTPDGANVKKWIPDAVHTDCEKCTPKQRVMVAKMIRRMQAKLPVEWEKMYAMHDAEKKHTEKLEAYLKKYIP